MLKKHQQSYFFLVNRISRFFVYTQISKLVHKYFLTRTIDYMSPISLYIIFITCLLLLSYFYYVLLFKLICFQYTVNII